SPGHRRLVGPPGTPYAQRFGPTDWEHGAWHSGRSPMIGRGRIAGMLPGEKADPGGTGKIPLLAGPAGGRGALCVPAAGSMDAAPRGRWGAGLRVAPRC